MKDLFILLRHKLRYLLRLDDPADEQMVIEGIRSAVEFRGAKLWILVLAVFVASLGLNTNSAAVIIGAMLISPLMGPIIGMGMGLAIYDSQLLKRSVRSYLIATVFSVITATIYFFISPYSVVQSELLARTSPTIYDVLIALCGGLAGIIALGSMNQRQGNVIPGVAIATALMPPLCTVGFGIATGNWSYAAGALYLFVINTIFIALSTFLGATFIMRFHKLQDMDKVRQRRARRLSIGIIVLTIIPAIWLTIGMVRESYFQQHVGQFIAQELHWQNTQVISHKCDFDTKSFTIVLIGEEVDSIRLADAKARLPYYGLEGVDMQVMQSASGIDQDDLFAMMSASNTQLHHDETIIAQQQARINELERLLEPYQADRMSETLYNELHLLWPQINRVSIAHGRTSGDFSALASADTLSIEHHERTLVILQITARLTQAEEERLRTWLCQRAQPNEIEIIIIQ